MVGIMGIKSESKGNRAKERAGLMEQAVRNAVNVDWSFLAGIELRCLKCISAGPLIRVLREGYGFAGERARFVCIVLYCIVLFCFVCFSCLLFLLALHGYIYVRATSS